MAKVFSRKDRIGDSIKRLLATTIQREIADPRVGMVNINDVNVSRDLAVAKVFVTFVGQDDEQRCEQAIEILNKVSGLLRSFLAKELNMRVTPKLHFFYDKTPKQGQALSSLIERALAEDQARHKE